MVDRTLILGFGNLDRQDDGVAWHVLRLLMDRLSLPAGLELSAYPVPEDGNPQLIFVLQLTPELAEVISTYDAVCFVDAHTGDIPAGIQMVDVQGSYQRSAFTHHMTPATLLELSKELYGCSPRAILVSIRGYQFGFSANLSERTFRLVEDAAGMIYDWLGHGLTGDNQTPLK